MKTDKELIETWNKIASLYEDTFMDLDIYNDTYSFFCNAINNDNAKLLEIGCGPGNITKYLLSKHSNFNIDGTDISINMIELAKKNNPQANFNVMDAKEINKITTKYDGVICGFCLPYLSESESDKLISDSYNLLVDNGIIYLSFVEGESSKSGIVSSGGNNIYFYYHNLENLSTQLINNRFNILKTFKIKYAKSKEVSEVHVIIIAQKLI